jgi:hypothetical protein
MGPGQGRSEPPAVIAGQKVKFAGFKQGAKRGPCALGRDIVQRCRAVPGIVIIHKNALLYQVINLFGFCILGSGYQLLATIYY